MDEKHEKVLKESSCVLRKRLEPMKLLSHLAIVLDNDDVEKIKNQKNRVDQCDMLLEMLPRRGPNAFDRFVQALQKEQTQDYLAPFLTKQLGNNCSASSCLYHSCQRNLGIWF